MKVYVILQEWDINCGRDCQILTNGYTNLKDAQDELKKLLEKEKENGWFDLNNEDTFFTETETSWCIDVNYYEKFMETSILAVEI